MRISIAPDLEAFVKDKVTAGRFRSTEEAINEALRLLRDRDEAEFEALRGLLNERVKESKRGHSVPFDSALRRDIRRRGIKRLTAAKKARS